jgi:hypothetical protein
MDARTGDVCGLKIVRDFLKGEGGQFLAAGIQQHGQVVRAVIALQHPAHFDQVAVLRLARRRNRGDHAGRQVMPADIPERVLGDLAAAGELPGDIHR